MKTASAQRGVLWLMAALVVAAPSVAWACPFCASGRQSPGVSALVMGIIILPFVVAGIVLRVVLRTARDLEGAPVGLPSLEER